VDESATVLDVGFGLGYGLNILAIKAKEVNGVDVDKKVYDYDEFTLLPGNCCWQKSKVSSLEHL
jgi:protein-L-isoaspartate O-methyltransferase